MPLPPDFPTSPHDVLDPAARWLPDASGAFTHQLPPLVPTLRKLVKEWRDSGYDGASAAGVALLRWWFEQPHPLPDDGDGVGEFRYYFAQREAIETIIYLYEVQQVKDKYDLMRFDSSGEVSSGQFAEDWLRFVIKMATGSGKTKVLSLALAWCYFHKLYEADSRLARNFLIIAPNIIVLDRLRKDFEGLRIFYADPVLPENGYEGRNWRDDFQLTVHVQDEVRAVQSVGNVFLTNIHRVYTGSDTLPSADDEDTRAYFLGPRPTGATTDSKVDLGAVVRDVDELAVFNDEAHHIHDQKMAWFKSIEDIHHQLKQKGSGLALQVDTSATPKHNAGGIFVQTVTDYPLVEAIAQNVVKHPVIPDKTSRDSLKEKPSSKFSEKYADYLQLGVVEWRKATDDNDRMGKKSILFVMTDDTKNCDEVAAYLESTCPDLQDKVLVIHTKDNGEISEASSKKAKEELDKLRRAANNIDGLDSPYKAVVSVLVLKEGWDVRNVTTIVGLRAYSSKARILPEQTLGRGLRRMYPGEDGEEELSVVGTNDFMEFVESITQEGVTLKQKSMGTSDNTQKSRLLVEVDRDNPARDIEALDIQIPVLEPRMYRDYGRLDALDSKTFTHAKEPYKHFGDAETREIAFVYTVTGEESHTMELSPSSVSDYRSVVRHFSDVVAKELRLGGVYDVVYGKMKAFIRDDLFEHPVDLEDRNTLCNLSELGVMQRVVDVFRREVNALTLRDKGGAEVSKWIRVSATRPFWVEPQGYIVPQKSVFNKIVGDQSLERKFAEFLEHCGDVVSYAKNYFAVGFRLDYVKANGDFSNYYPDFLVKTSSSDLYVVETKGLVDEDVPPKMARLKQWCEDVNKAQSEVVCGFVYVDEGGFARYTPRSFGELVGNFRGFQ